MLKQKIQHLIKKIIAGEIELERPANPAYGDYSTNLALRIAKKSGKNPMEIAEEIKTKLVACRLPLVARIEAAPPGFINFWLSEKILQEELKEILKKGKDYGSSNLGKNKKLNIEFISANPTGVLHIGHGRGGFLGDVLANVLKFSGYKVAREYYINNAQAGAQIKELGKTVLGKGKNYLTKDLKTKISKLKPKIKKIKDNSPAGNIEGKIGCLLAGEIQKENQKFIEKNLKIKFDNWFSEESLYQTGQIEKVLKNLEEKKLVYRKENALWLKAREFGDNEDRVLVRSSGEPAYFLSDLAYHLNKFKIRKFNKAIDIWGADHYGYLPRLKAGLKSLAVPEDKLEVIITQLVRLKKDGKEMKMSKRAGEFVALKDLIREAGLDAARFFFLMSSPNTHMDFDLKLAKERSLKNPVYYVQYAAVRCQSILQKSRIPKQKSGNKINFSLLNTPEDISLMKLLARFPETVETAAKDYNSQILIHFALDLAKEFHNFYEKERIIGQERNLMLARLELLKAAQIVFQNLFNLLGIALIHKM